MRCARAPNARRDGNYRITGQKIFITYGDHDLTDNIVHLVLARLPDAPPGTRGISLFIVPKFLVNADGTLGARNDVALQRRRAQAGHPRLADLHHGLRRRGRRGRLSRRRGEPRPRLHVHDDEQRAARVGLQGVGVAERAYQQALAFARSAGRARRRALRATA